MKVKCIREGFPGENKKYAPKKGKIYKVDSILNTTCRVDGTDNYTWYIIEELGNYQQHSSLFKIIEIEDHYLLELITRYYKKMNSVALLNKVFKIK